MILTPKELLAAARRARDYNDLMLELSGLSAGIIPRFLTPAQIERIREANGLPRKAGETRAERAWRQYLELTDSISRQLFEVQKAINRALVKSERRVEAAREELDRIRERATVDGKGRRVYRTADRQRGFTDDGQELSREEFQAVHWDPAAPTWEQRQAAGKRYQEALQAHEEILRAKERVDHYAQRMASGEVPSIDELDMIRKDLDAMPQAVRAEMEAERGAAAVKMAKSTEPGRLEEFTLSAQELASIRPDPPAHDLPPPPPKFAPKL